MENVTLNGVGRDGAKAAVVGGIKNNSSLVEAVRCLIDAMPEGENVRVEVSGDFENDGEVRSRTGTISVTTSGPKVKELDSKREVALNDDGDRTNINARVIGRDYSNEPDAGPSY